MIDTIVVAGYLAGILVFGIWAGRGSRTIEDYSVAGRSFGSLTIFFTLAASFIGGGFSIGNAGKVFSVGIAAIVALWGFSLIQLVVASKIAPRMGEFRHARSAGDIMERGYGKAGKVVTGVFSLLVCAGIVGAQVGAMGNVFEIFVGMPRLWGILIGCGIVILYATTGGMRAVVMTDMVQFGLLAVGIPLTLLIGVQAVGGWAALVEAVPAGHWSVPAVGSGWAALISLFLVFLLGETLVPPYVQRLLVARDAGAVRRGTLWAGLFSIPFFAVAGAIGLVALVLAPDIDSALALPHVVNTVLPPVIRGLVVAAMIAVVMSSADSFLNAAAVAVTNDIVQPLARRAPSEGALLAYARIATVVVGLLAVWFAVSIPNVLDILIYAYDFWAPVILVPLVAVLLGVRAGFPALLAAATAGVVVTAGWNNLLDRPAGIDGLVIGVAANALAFAAFAGSSRRVLAAEADDA